MAGSPGTVPAPDLPPGPRYALVIATTDYEDASLRQLRAPARDAADLAEALADPQIGAFTVTSVINESARGIRRTVEHFLAERLRDDLVLVYLSCHGLKDASGRLYLAATDTEKSYLGSTGVEAPWVLDQIEHCRARSQILILDSCFSGAFGRTKGDADVVLDEKFTRPGRGLIVITASNSTEYSYEGEPTGAMATGSVFTSALVEGLRTGAADTDHDGLITVDEAYTHTYEQLRGAGVAQTPQRWSFKSEGTIVLARSPAGMTITPAALLEDLGVSLNSRHTTIRIGAVHTLGEWLTGDDLARARTAEQKLRQIADTTDKPAVATLARAYLAAPRRALTEAATPISTMPVTSRKPLDLTTDDELDLIADDVSRMRCILFLGAGVHAPPPAQSQFEYPAEQRPPVGAHLSLKLAADCNFSGRFPGEDPSNLQKVARCYEIARSRHQLVNAVKDAVQTGKRPSPMLRLLAELGFPLVITTNYDQLFENALIAAGKQPRVTVYTPNLEPTTEYRDPTAESPVVFKLHGDILRPETIVITEEDYIQFTLRMSSKDPYDPVPLTLKYYLTGWTSLFVGYDRNDYSTSVLLQTLRWKIDSASMPDMYFVDYQPDPLPLDLPLDVWHNQRRRYRKSIAQDLWTFLPGLYERVLGKEFRP